MKAYQFKPGQSGNPTGRPKGLTDPLKAFLSRKVPGDPEGRRYLEKLVESMVERAIAKSDVLVKEIFDRVERSTQMATVSNFAEIENQKLLRALRICETTDGASIQEDKITE